MPEKYVVVMTKQQTFDNQKDAIEMAISTAKKAGGVLRVFREVDGKREKVFECEDTIV